MATSRRPDGPDLVVAGASVRAFACSAARAGWRIHAADLFCDADLRAAAATTVAAAGHGGRRYPHSLVVAVAGLPAGPWCYTGGLENHPAVIAAIAAERTLLGTSATAARAVRDHGRLANAVRGAGLRFPDTHSAADDVPRDGTFLVKPRASAGGRGIAVWDGAVGERPTAGHVWQRRVAGEPWAAAYAITATGGACLWGVSRQLVGLDWCHARPFAYCGSLDLPLPLVAPSIRADLERLGRRLAAAFAPLGLAGLVGVDLVVDGTGHVHVIEVNPRPTASMELIERAGGASLAAAHVAACEGRLPTAPDSVSRRVVWGKAVLFAARDILLDAATAARLRRACPTPTGAEEPWPAVADIPCPGTAIPAAAPLLTIYAAADGHAAVLDLLRCRAAAIESAVSAGEPAGR